MPKLLVANTNFEWELTQTELLSPNQAFHKHPFFIQLQYLPFFYSEPGDGIAVSSKPSEEFFDKLEAFNISPSRIHTFSENDFSSYECLESWGPSLILAKWAYDHQIDYPIPEWETVMKVNSKAYSFQSAPKLPGAALLENEAQAKHWFLSQNGQVVLKTCYGFAGKGHLRLTASMETFPQALKFMQMEWELDRPILAEPWVDRLLDFSTQWRILGVDEIEFLAATRFDSDEQGSYRCSYAGETHALFGKWKPFLDEHMVVALPILKKMAVLGYFGNVGIDAMIYQSDSAGLHPILEINGRKTMGWFAHLMQKRFFPDQMIRLSYSKKLQGVSILPNSSEDQKKPFLRHLCVEAESYLQENQSNVNT